MATSVACQASHRSASLRPISAAVTAVMIEIATKMKYSAVRSANGLGMTDRGRVGRIGQKGHQADTYESHCGDGQADSAYAETPEPTQRKGSDHPDQATKGDAGGYRPGQQTGC